jgi:hypothetical protein
MKNSLIITETEKLNKVLFTTFKTIKDPIFKNEIYALILEADMLIRMAHDRTMPRSFVRTLEKARGVWSKLQSMLLLAETLEFCRPEQAEKCLKQLETTQKISFGLLRHIEARKKAKQESAA